MIDVSVIIVNWNTEELLLNCIESIISETRDCSYEIIVVDNASSDNSVISVRKKYPDVVVIENQENLGFSKANNQGIAISRGLYVCLINSDVIVLENSIDALMHHISSDKSIGAIAPMTINGKNVIRRNVRKFPNLWNIFCETIFLHRVFKNSTVLGGRAVPLSKYGSLNEVESVSGCFLMVPRKVIDEIGALDEAFFFYTEDVDWCKRIHNAGLKVVYKADVKSVHLGGESSIAAPAKYQKIMEKSDLIYWMKHFNKATVSVYKFLRKMKCYFSIGALRIKNDKSDSTEAKIEGFQARIEIINNN